jgi:hypothetical protein
LGLRLVDRLCERWGVAHPDSETKAVWFEFCVIAPQLEPWPLEVRGRAHVACPDCGLRLYTADAWTLLERCPRCQTGLTRHPSTTLISHGREAGGRVLGHEA